MAQWKCGAVTSPEPLPPVVSKSERAYEALRQRIEDGTYGPGQRLVLDRIARELDVSPVPVREAIRRLEAEGFIVFERNVGAQVAAIDPAEYAHTMQVLALLEGAATALAAPELGADRIAEAVRINDEMRLTLDQFDPVRFTHLNHEFHQVLCAGCPNPHLRGLIEREWSRLGMIRRSSFNFAPGRAHASVREHAHLLDLITSGAPAAEIEQAARAHKLATLGAVLERTTPSTAPVVGNP
jgi:DNA-binding GntR family transcriptional regulator